MTENEAIVQLNFDMEMIRFNPNTGETLTLEQIKERNEDNYKTYLADEVAITALMEIQELHTIGTIEEFKALKGKSLAKKPIFKFKYEDSTQFYDCPVCKTYGIGDLVGVRSTNIEGGWEKEFYNIELEEQKT